MTSLDPVPRPSLERGTALSTIYTTAEQQRQAAESLRRAAEDHALTVHAFVTAIANGEQPDKVVAELQDSHRKFVPAEMLVQFKPGVAKALRDLALTKVGAKVLERVRGDLHRISPPPGRTRRSTGSNPSPFR